MQIMAFIQPSMENCVTVNRGVGTNVAVSVFPARAKKAADSTDVMRCEHLHRNCEFERN